MKKLKYSTKIIIFIIVICISIFINSNAEKNYNTIFNSRVIAEGTVIKIRSGGTREIQYPSGYAIKYPVWVAAPTITNTVVFLRTNNYPLKYFIDKRVRVEGEFIQLPAKR